MFSVRDEGIGSILISLLPDARTSRQVECRLVPVEQDRDCLSTKNCLPMDETCSEVVYQGTKKMTLLLESVNMRQSSASMDSKGCDAKKIEMRRMVISFLSNCSYQEVVAREPLRVLLNVVTALILIQSSLVASRVDPLWQDSKERRSASELLGSGDELQVRAGLLLCSDSRTLASCVLEIGHMIRSGNHKTCRRLLAAVLSNSGIPTLLIRELKSMLEDDATRESVLEVLSFVDKCPDELVVKIIELYPNLDSKSVSYAIEIISRNVSGLWDAPQIGSQLLGSLCESVRFCEEIIDLIGLPRQGGNTIATNIALVAKDATLSTNAQFNATMCLLASVAAEREWVKDIPFEGADEHQVLQFISRIVTHKTCRFEATPSLVAFVHALLMSQSNTRVEIGLRIGLNLKRIEFSTLKALMEALPAAEWVPAISDGLFSHCARDDPRFSKMLQQIEFNVDSRLYGAAVRHLSDCGLLAESTVRSLASKLDKSELFDRDLLHAYWKCANDIGCDELIHLIDSVCRSDRQFRAAMAAGFPIFLRDCTRRLLLNGDLSKPSVKDQSKGAYESIVFWFATIQDQSSRSGAIVRRLLLDIQRAENVYVKVLLLKALEMKGVESVERPGIVEAVLFKSSGELVVWSKGFDGVGGFARSLLGVDGLYGDSVGDLIRSRGIRSETDYEKAVSAAIRNRGDQRIILPLVDYLAQSRRPIRVDPMVWRPEDVSDELWVDFVWEKTVRIDSACTLSVARLAKPGFGTKELVIVSSVSVDNVIQRYGALCETSDNSAESYHLVCGSAIADTDKSDQSEHLSHFFLMRLSGSSAHRPIFARWRKTR